MRFDELSVRESGQGSICMLRARVGHIDRRIELNANDESPADTIRRSSRNPTTAETPNPGKAADSNTVGDGLKTGVVEGANVVEIASGQRDALFRVHQVLVKFQEGRVRLELGIVLLDGAKNRCGGLRVRPWFSGPGGD